MQRRHPLVAMQQCLLVLLALLLPSFALAQEAGNADPKPAKVEPRYWTTQWSFQDIRVGKLADRLKSIGIDTGLVLDGIVSVDFNVSVPITALRDAAAYRFDGTLTSPSLVVDDVLMKNLSTSVSYRDGVVTLEKLNSQISNREQPTNRPGSIEGNATAKLVPREDLHAELNAKDLSIAPLSNLLAKYLGEKDHRLPEDGVFSCDVTVNVPLDSVSDINAYQLDGAFQGRGLRIDKLSQVDFDAKRVRIEDKRLLVDDVLLKAGSSDRPDDAIRMFGNASLPLDGQGDFRFEVYGDDVPLESIAQLALQPRHVGSSIVGGKLDFRVIGTGRLNERIDSSTWNIDGSIASPKLIVAGTDLGTLEHNFSWTPSLLEMTPKRSPNALPPTFRVGALKATYAVSDVAIVIDELEATVFDGRINGSVTVPLTDTGTAIAKFAVDSLRPRFKLTLGGRTLDVSGSLVGDVDWQFPLNAMDQPAGHSGQLSLAVSKLTLGNAPVGEINVNASADAGEVTFNADGDVLDGHFEASAVANVQTEDNWSDLVSRLNTTELSFKDVSFKRVLDTANIASEEVSGLASGKLSILDWGAQSWESQSQPNFTLPSADVEFVLTQLNHRSRLLSREVRVNGQLRSNVLDITSLVGDYADGSVRAKGRIYLIDQAAAIHPRADLRMSASRVDLKRALWFLGDTADDFQGRASLSGTLAGYQESLRLRGNCDGTDLLLYGLPLGRAHSAFAADANVSRASWNLRLPSVRSIQGGGQVEGELSLASTRVGGRGVDLTSRWRTRRVDFLRVTQQLGKSNSLARGEITGDLTLGGKAIRGLNDLTGRFDFTLGQTRGAAIPGLLAVSRFLGPISLVSQTFDVGEVKGVIGGGAITIDEFWIGSDTALVQADGKVYISSGRMDLNALIATGDYRDIAANFAQLAQQYALRSLLPASAILDISELLSDRTLVVRVMGTLRDPIVRIQPVQTFREETARFLIREGQRLILLGITADAANGLD